MSLRTYPGRFLAGSASASVLVLLLCGTVAVYLDREQDRTANVLSENIGGGQAAADLAASIDDLIALYRQEVTDVEPLHGRIATHLRRIHLLADKERELELSEQASAAFTQYLDARSHGCPP